ncbi:MAG: prolipoprotein diacylglyceryl transferase [Actinobacteria bacterium]|nr:prolipoprotein diacylglyceryl transferase [Actinomycetota bacterium]NDA38751.1 prolipoprotein diacylglyceryl transferase [Actinomycetota bacterium]NDE12098.1 prolipoprotein diacylglyceryl transferase [Actinomycetota bacterium]NDE83251.1 prolipoprotein diacylglyceryl transferase [Actinomycetota bacterium]
MSSLNIPSPARSLIEIGPLTIHYYALCIMLGIVAAVIIGNKRYVAKGGAAGLVGDVAIFAVPSGIIGGRLYHVITSPEKYFGANGNPIEALYIWQGGLGIWGAISLGALGAFLAYRKNPKRGELSFASFADAIAPGLLVAQGIGRFGNWFNKELFGRPLDAPWALEIPIRYRPIGYSKFETFHPTFLYEAIWCFAAAALLVLIGKRKALVAGSLFALYVAIYSLGRGVIETLRIDESNLIMGLRLNLWTSLILLVSASFIAFKLNRKNASKVGA